LENSTNTVKLHAGEGLNQLRDRLKVLKKKNLNKQCQRQKGKKALKSIKKSYPNKYNIFLIS